MVRFQHSTYLQPDTVHLFRILDNPESLLLKWQLNYLGIHTCVSVSVLLNVVCACQVAVHDIA